MHITLDLLRKYAVSDVGISQVGYVVFQDFKAVDNGAGPAASAALVNGKDHGGGLEMTWIVDDGPRTPHGEVRAVTNQTTTRHARHTLLNGPTRFHIRISLGYPTRGLITSRLPTRLTLLQ